MLTPNLMQNTPPKAYHVQYHHQLNDISIRCALYTSLEVLLEVLFNDKFLLLNSQEPALQYRPSPPSTPTNSAYLQNFIGSHILELNIHHGPNARNPKSS